MKPYRKWRQIFAWGHTDHPQGAFDVDVQFYRDLLHAFKVLRDEHKYLPPVTAMHPEIIQDLTGISELRGANYGVVGGLRCNDEGIEAGFFLNELGAKLDALGAIGYISPSFYRAWVDPHTGTRLGPVLREVSLVDVPHQKNISADVGRVYGLSDAVSLVESGFNNPIFLGANMMDEESTEEPAVDETTDAAEPTLVEVLAAIVDLTAKIDALGVAEVEEDSAEVEGEMSLADEVKSLRYDLKLEKAANAVRTDLGAAASDALVRSLAPMHLGDLASYKVVAAGIKSKPATAQQPAGNVGAQSAATSLSEKNVVTLIEQAASAGIKRGLPLVKFMRSKGVENAALSLSEHADSVTRIYSVTNGGR
jgi:hypothetical protein